LPAGEVDNLWATDNACPRALLAGHIDVVPPGDETAWHSAPFIAEERDGYIYGRGAADMKAGVAAMLCAATRLRQQGINGIAILLTSDEEGPALHGTRHVVEWWQKNNEECIDYAIVGEPTCEEFFGDTIKTGRRGSLTARIIVHGQQTHVAYPHRGDNPNHQLINALETMRQNWPPCLTAEASSAPSTGFQVVSLKSGAGANNITPASATATINFRYAPADDPAQLQQTLESSLTQTTGKNWTCDWEHSAEPFFTATDSVLVHALQEEIDKVTGRRPALSTGGGTSDGRFLRTICRELVEFGPRNETIHAPNERVGIEEVRQLATIYEKTVQGLLLSKN
jgi:succinyl-diaminopimelate desuccinylase